MGRAQEVEASGIAVVDLVAELRTKSTCVLAASSAVKPMRCSASMRPTDLTDATKASDDHGVS